MPICRHITEAAQAPIVRAQRSSILLVDDDPTLLEMVGGLLRDEGYQVSTAETGGEALAHLRAGRPDLILLDLMMPGEDGWQFLERLRTHPVAASVPVVLLSAVRGLSDQAERLRVDDFLPKPFEVDKLLDKVNKLAITR